MNCSERLAFGFRFIFNNGCWPVFVIAGCKREGKQTVKGRQPIAKIAMKQILTIFLAGVSTLAFAQKNTDLSRSIDDNGEKLSIKVSGTVDGRFIDYEHTFVVGDLSKFERKQLSEHILDSLGVGGMEALLPPAAPVAPLPPKAPVHLSANGAHSMISASESRNTNINNEETSASKTFSKEVRFDDRSGELYIHYQFMRGDEAFSYEKTVDASDKTERQRQIIIENFEREIALPVQ